MVNELSEAFLYAQSAFELWKEVTERYGQSNGPLIYQLERELSKITQGNLTIAAFFNKLKRCWDELQNLNGLPVCECGKMNECTCSIYEKFLERDNMDEEPLVDRNDPPHVVPNTPVSSRSNDGVDSSVPSPVPMAAEPSIPPPINNPLPTRKSTRAATKPAWLKDFVTPKASVRDH
ncbi:hypothetical protein CTI12_AA427070 [Artemisia annua]|uniref:Uncharacterized protein n=1 Tax=Artemisia annua TaxID=35608 RepID=A0A2U1M2Z4_ARTAN|nr:hypothetical protein CTI12_AA427070 [Artemisia annua]